jgi:prophage tail gpP-like protein
MFIGTNMIMHELNYSSRGEYWENNVQLVFLVDQFHPNPVYPIYCQMRFNTKSSPCPSARSRPKFSPIFPTPDIPRSNANQNRKKGKGKKKKKKKKKKKRKKKKNTKRKQNTQTIHNTQNTIHTPHINHT